jgi:hypothetical protein
MNNHPIAFFFTEANDVFHSSQSTCLLSHTLISPKDLRNGSIKGNGVFMYKDKLAHPIALFCARSLVKSHWVNSNDVFIGREDK